MFFSLRLAALTLSALSISNNVLGSVIPLVKPFVFLSACPLIFWLVTLLYKDLSNFVMVMQNFADVLTETPPSSAFTILSLTAWILSPVRILFIFIFFIKRHFFFSAVERYYFSQYTVARTQEVDVATQLRMGARLLQAQAHMCVLFSNVHVFNILISLISYFLGMGKIFTSATPVSFFFFTKPMAIYYQP